MESSYQSFHRRRGSPANRTMRTHSLLSRGVPSISTHPLKLPTLYSHLPIVISFLSRFHPSSAWLPTLLLAAPPRRLLVFFPFQCGQDVLKIGLSRDREGGSRVIEAMRARCGGRRERRREATELEVAPAVHTLERVRSMCRLQVGCVWTDCVYSS